jgi:hypothetical protein
MEVLFFAETAYKKRETGHGAEKLAQSKIFVLRGAEPAASWVGLKFSNSD